ncbi:MAG: fibronectin type III domain-containing protein, partial [bacterium]
WAGVGARAVAAQDGAGNHSEPARLTIRVDAEAEPPAALRSSSHPDAEEWQRSRAVTLEWDAPVEVSGVKGYRWSVAREHDDPGPASGWTEAAASPLSFGVPDDGHWIVRVVTEDRVGNRSAPAAFALRVDSMASTPQLELPRHPKPDVWYADATVDVRAEAKDDASGVAEILLGYGADERAALAALKPVSGGAAALALGKGAWTVAAVAVDHAGNRSAPATRRVQVDPAVRPPLVICQSHPDPDRWYASLDVRFSVMPAEGGAGKQEYWMLLDDKPATQPSKAAGFAAAPGLVKVAAPGPGEWWLHVVSVTESAGLATEPVHARVRVDTAPPPAPAVRSATHPSAPRRTRARDGVFQWEEPADLSGIREYQYSLMRQTMLGMKKDKAGTTPERSVALAGLEPASYELTVTAVDGAGHAGAPAKYPFVVSDTQDVCVAVKSESWRVARAALEVELRAGDKLLKRGKTDGSGEAWFKDMPYEPFAVVVNVPKPNPSLIFEGVAPAPGEAHLRFEVSLASCAWAVCAGGIRLWAPEHWAAEGGRIEIIGEKGPAKGVHMLKDLAREGAYLVCPLPADMPEGKFHLMGGPLNKLDWPPLPFKRP